MAKQYKIMVALNDTIESWDAVDAAIQLCTHFAPDAYRLLLVYVVALNPVQSLPYLDHLDRAYNIEIIENAQKEVDACKNHLLKCYSGKVNYEFVQVEGEGETGPVIAQYLAESHADLNMLVLGSRNLTGVKKLLQGSVSEYLMHHVTCPVLIVKDKEDTKHVHSPTKNQ